MSFFFFIKKIVLVIRPDKYRNKRTTFCTVRIGRDRVKAPTSRIDEDIKRLMWAQVAAFCVMRQMLRIICYDKSWAAALDPVLCTVGLWDTFWNNNFSSLALWASQGSKENKYWEFLSDFCGCFCSTFCGQINIIVFFKNLINISFSKD